MLFINAEPEIEPGFDGGRVGQQKRQIHQLLRRLSRLHPHRQF